MILQEVVKLEINSTTTRNTFLLFLYRDTQVKLSCYNSACLQSQIKKPPVYMKSSNESLRGHFTQDNCRLPPVIENPGQSSQFTHAFSCSSQAITLCTQNRKEIKHENPIFSQETLTNSFGTTLPTNGTRGMRMNLTLTSIDRLLTSIFYSPSTTNACG